MTHPDEFYNDKCGCNNLFDVVLFELNVSLNELPETTAIKLIIVNEWSDQVHEVRGYCE